MKKLLSLALAILMCFSITLTLASCGHEHEYKTEWSKDATHHWHDCADPECKEPADKAEHSWNAGERTSFAVTTYTCTVCGQTKTETANTTVTADQWTAAFNLGENFTISAEQRIPERGVQNITEKRAGTLFEKLTVSTPVDPDAAVSESYNFCKIENDVFYKYVPFYDNGVFVGYYVYAKEGTVEENIAEIIEEYFPMTLRDMSLYTYNSETFLYEAAEANANSVPIKNLTIGFIDGKLISISYEINYGNITVPVSMSFTYGDATVTLPSEDQIIPAP